jgi:hypothetical protein
MFPFTPELCGNSNSFGKHYIQRSPGGLIAWFWLNPEIVVYQGKDPQGEQNESQHKRMPGSSEGIGGVS